MLDRQPGNEGRTDAAASTLMNGAPATSERHSLTVGPNGPTMLHDVTFVETMAHFDRERVPERVVHAKGAGAFGEFECTGDVSAYTKAALFQPGVKTPMFARFSTVAGEQGSPDTWRDPRGFALKFYTSEGNYDLVGNNTPIFFIRDAMRFPHFIHSQKRLGATGLRDHNMQWDFWTSSPESAHQVTYLMGMRGIPKTYRNMNGYGSHTYMWVNAAGERFWVKYAFISDQGVEGLTDAEAEHLAGTNPDVHRADLYEAITSGNFPSWTLQVQVIPYEDAKNYKINIFDVTKTVPFEDYPRITVGKMTLNRIPDNFFAEVEQAAFAPSNLVPGIGLSPDKMLLGRVFSYADTQRHRIGANYQQLPVNAARVPVNTYQQDGPMAYTHNGDQTVHAPNTTGRGYADAAASPEETWGLDDPELVRDWQPRQSDMDDDFTQAGIMVRDVFTDAERDEFVGTVSRHLLAGVEEDVLQRAFEYWKNVDAQIGARIEAAVREGQAK